MTSSTRPRGRPRDARLDASILAAAERELREKGFAGMTIESVAAAAGTTAPAVYRRHRDKAALAVAVVDSLRVEPLDDMSAPARERALAVLENFRRNLERPHAMAALGSMLAEEQRAPLLLDRFRTRLARPRRAMLRQALSDGRDSGELAGDLDLDVATTMLIGSFYARYVAGDAIPRTWPHRVLATIWPAAR